jgi:hypothetical protein
MRIALIKQQFDVFGPWQSIAWETSSPERLFDCWPGKAVYWEMTCLLQADWYVIPQQKTNAYIYDAVHRVPGRREMIEAHSQTVSHVPLELYDIVISLDPVLPSKLKATPLLAYYAQEHWDPLYRRSLRKPDAPYDLFLDHMLSASGTLRTLPVAVGFPYLRAPEDARKQFCTGEKFDAIWVEARAVTTLSMSTEWDAACTATLERLTHLFGLPAQSRKHAVRDAPYAISDPPTWGDARNYLRELASCRYFASFGRVAGAGQGLCDAASLGCICVGERSKTYHRVVCHPAALCDDMYDVPRVLRRLISSESLRQEVLAWQDRALDEYFNRRPLALLAEAAAMKTRGGL